MTISGIAAASSTAIGNLRLKYSFSRQHLKAGSHFAKSADAIESASIKLSAEEELSQHRAYITGAVISVASALEASINELYLEAQDGNPHTLKGLEPRAVSILAQFWPEIERYPILHKYQTALLIIGVHKFDKGGPPYQDTESLIKLRDALVHYKPEWDNELNVHEGLEKRLKGKFPENRLAQSESLWFPHKCLSSGCAQWTVNTANVFMQGFCQRTQIPMRF